MSVQLGRLHFMGRPIDPDALAKMNRILTPYSPDGYRTYSDGGLYLSYRPFHTTKESWQEQQPHITRSGFVLMWDGRLDNRKEICAQIGPSVSIHDTDVAIVGAAVDLWGIGCLPHLVGDWALSIWNPRDRTLFLAKDFLGSRHLYYQLERQEIVWTTVLDLLILGSNGSLHLDQEYIAAWLGTLPPTHLTPYSGIQEVRPGSCLIVRDGEAKVEDYWHFDCRKRISYRSDQEYEAHFRQLFSQSVVRRLRSQTPVLAELSGGIDSSSIVCIADDAIANGQAEAARPCTVSYYDDAEPNWNEKPYFTIVEQQRGQVGWHIDVGSGGRLRQDDDYIRFRATPSSTEYFTKSHREFISCVTLGQHRVILSGTGGDEVLGGVPTPIPELADLLTTLRLREFSRQLKLWALHRRKPCIQLALDVVRRFTPQGIRRSIPAPWIRTEFVRRHREAFHCGRKRTQVLGALPSYQDYLETLEGIRRGLASAPLEANPLCERTYPYLDRDLLEFLYAIPRGQLLRPQQRRSLMRRALAGIVPDAVLNRRRKAFVARGPITTLAAAWPIVIEQARGLCCEELGIIDTALLAKAFQNARRGLEADIPAMSRALRLETWLISLREHGFDQISQSPKVDHNSVRLRHEKYCSRTTPQR